MLKWKLHLWSYIIFTRSLLNKHFSNRLLWNPLKFTTLVCNTYILFTYLVGLTYTAILVLNYNTRSMKVVKWLYRLSIWYTIVNLSVFYFITYLVWLTYTAILVPTTKLEHKKYESSQIKWLYRPSIGYTIVNLSVLFFILFYCFFFFLGEFLWGPWRGSRIWGWRRP